MKPSDLNVATLLAGERVKQLDTGKRPARLQQETLSIKFLSSRAWYR